MRTCINCRVNPEGPERIGVTERGHVFISRACESCQRQVDRAVAATVMARWGQITA